MSSFADAAKQLASMTTTANGALSHASTSSARVDLFSGVLRGTEEARIQSLLAASYKEDALHTLKIVAYLRDVRGGKGEREAGRRALHWLAKSYPDVLSHNLAHYVSVYGRFDDLLAVMGTPLETTALGIWADQLRNDLDNMRKDEKQPVSLCAKWVPSEKKAADKKTRVHAKLAKVMGLSSADLRKTYLSPLRAHLQLLERHMCANEWDKIDLSAVPSVAMHIHGKPNHAFQRHLPETFATWKAGLKTGETKVNASVLFPHQVVSQYFGPYDAMATDVDPLLEAQWTAMVDHAKELGTLSRTVVMSDVSGSMNGLPMMVSLALGILVSSLAADEYKDLVMTFDSTPTFFHVQGDSLLAKVQCLAAAPWGGSTNFVAALRLIIALGVDKQIAREKMPQKLIVISDMQFDEADNAFETNYDVLKSEFAAAGYDVPQVIFWNVNGSSTDFPTLSSEANVSLISGYSPSVMKAALAGTSTSPLQTMLTAILDARYDLITLPPSDDDDDMEIV
ncbi:hypothetical protein SPRG_02062 [Saprolegnia parasitica CBS 223.65]|uniref:TROVE domain-containing protein n=1 Tax=Saprolegnia parasitica (strain CBS 223.65) TaxID=695850 RepID=A0A067CRZ2_SAPPC|nr:hypothetical protein SPRG_02062 [Saprolegnia parasitica CBS 223.65]KDO33253.1 hypothetical protein SPRG_02062 [Saprolegnia parasitica CBS 223.65]|eukprot:XP_012196009.1 hypothetical protein SPRG_02062 [Saprolegnia parasitica CBS 223.65]